MKCQKSLHLISLLPRKNTCNVRDLIRDFSCLWGVLCGYTHLFRSNMFTHMCTGTKRAGGHNHLDTHWGLSCFFNCFPHPTQLIQSHLYKLTLIHTSKHLVWTQICRFIISCGPSREGQERQRQLKACKGNSVKWNTLSFSLSHTHISKVIQLFCWVKWLVYKKPPFHLLL